MEDYLQYIGSVMGTMALSGAAAVATSLYMSTLPSPVTPAIDLAMQSREVPDSDGARSSRFYPDGKFLEYIYEDARTLYHIMHRGAKVSGNGPCLGWRPGEEEPYEFISYKQTLERIKNFSSGLVHLGMKPGQDTFVGIYSQNRVEWVVTEHACYRQSAVIVPLYDTLGPHACSYIINQANIQVVVCDTENKVKSIVKETANTPNLKQIVVVQPISAELKRQVEAAGLKIYQFKEVEEIGKKYSCDPTIPKPADVATVCYTSGTTGDPKGVVLTHGNIISCSSAVILVMVTYSLLITFTYIEYL